MASSKRERELARMRAERQAARRAAVEAQRRKQRGIVLSILTALVVVGIVVVTTMALGGNDKNTLKTKPGASATPSATASTPAAEGPCVYTKAGAASKPVTGLPSAKGPASAKPVNAALTTNKGVIGLTLDAAKAPCTVNSFTFLAKQKYFDGTSCHRLTTTGIFVLQCGDPSATGSGGPGYSFADENLAGAVYPAGTVAMANAGPGTNGSQFFLVYKPTQLPPNYTPFGSISKGLEVVTKVAAGGSTPSGDGKPKIPVTLTKVTIS